MSVLNGIISDGAIGPLVPPFGRRLEAEAIIPLLGAWPLLLMKRENMLLLSVTECLWPMILKNRQDQGEFSLSGKSVGAGILNIARGMFLSL